MTYTVYMYTINNIRPLLYFLILVCAYEEKSKLSGTLIYITHHLNLCKINILLLVRK